MNSSDGLHRVSPKPYLQQKLHITCKNYDLETHSPFFYSSNSNIFHSWKVIHG